MCTIYTFPCFTFIGKKLIYNYLEYILIYSSFLLPAKMPAKKVKPNFYALRDNAQILLPLREQTTRMTMPIAEVPPQTHQGSTDSEICFWFILTEMFRVIIHHGHIIMNCSDLYVCDDVGTLHAVTYQLIVDLICSLCNPTNGFLLDNSLFLRTEQHTYMCKFPYSDWSNEYYEYFFQEWVKNCGKSTLSTTCFRICEGQTVQLSSPSPIASFTFEHKEEVKMDGKLKKHVVEHTVSDKNLNIPIYKGTRHACLLTRDNLTYLGRWELFCEHQFCPSSFLDLDRDYSRYTLECQQWDTVLHMMVDERERSRYNLRMRTVGFHYHDALHLYVAYLGCSTRVGNNLADYISSFVTDIKIVLQPFM